MYSFGQPLLLEETIPKHRPQDAGTHRLLKSCTALCCLAWHLHPQGPPLSGIQGDTPEISAGQPQDWKTSGCKAARQHSQALSFICGNKAPSSCRNVSFSSNGAAIPSPWRLLQDLSHAKVKTAHSHGCTTSIFHTAIILLILAFRSALLLKLRFLFPVKYPQLSF